MTTQLPDLAKTLLDRDTHVTLTTIAKDGSPHSTTMWAARDGDDVVFATVVGRAKEVHLRANNRVAVSFFDPDDPYAAVSIRGTATLATEGGTDLIQSLSQKYTGQPYTADEGTENVRVVVRVTPTKVHSH
jgi:PPOX class probable F420-dependent enzyme